MFRNCSVNIMSTFQIEVQNSHKNRDGKSAVSIRLTHHRQKAYLKTEYYVTDKQLSKEGKLKDRVIMRQLNDKIDTYESLIAKRIGNRADSMTAKELKEFLVRASKSITDSSIDFVEFSRVFIESKRPLQKARARRLTTTLNSLIDFVGREKISISEITSEILKSYEQYFFQPHTITRKNQLGKDITRYIGHVLPKELNA